MKQALEINPNKAQWEKGDFTRIAAFMRESGYEFVKSLGEIASLRVLDLGCGDGTTAVPLALSGAEVLGIDIAENLVEAGRRRAAHAGLAHLTFQEGDASNLVGVADSSFDLTVSLFGAMFARNPFDVAKEMVRVTRPGGRIVMGNWIPNDPTFVSQLLKISSSFTPAPPKDFISPMTWGLERNVIERFNEAGIPDENISTIRNTYVFYSHDNGPEDFVEALRRFYGPTMNAFEAAERTGSTEELHRQLLKLAQSENKSTSGGTSIPATYLRVTINL